MFGDRNDLDRRPPPPRPTTMADTFAFVLRADLSDEVLRRFTDRWLRRLHAYTRLTG